MSETDPEIPPFLRTVTFLDADPDDLTQPPVHVAFRLLLDGVDHSRVLARRGKIIDHEWRVFSNPETIVSFVAYNEFLTLKMYPDQHHAGQEVLSGTHIDGVPVMTPAAFSWEPIEVGEGEPEQTRVFLHVREVKILAPIFPRAHELKDVAG